MVKSWSTRIVIAWSAMDLADHATTTAPFGPHRCVPERSTNCRVRLSEITSVTQNRLAVARNVTSPPGDYVKVSDNEPSPTRPVLSNKTIGWVGIAVLLVPVATAALLLIVAGSPIPSPGSR
jgi:hypothetical protein